MVTGQEKQREPIGSYSSRSDVHTGNIICESNIKPRIMGQFLTKNYTRREK